MKRTAHWLPGCALSLAMLLSGCGNGRNNGGTQPEPPSAQPGSRAENQPEGALRIRVETDTHSIVFLLNSSPAAISLYAQLPLTLPVENFGINEKIVYPPEELEVDGHARRAEGPAGTLAYYAPWGNVAMFYGTCGGASGPVCLGRGRHRRRPDRAPHGDDPDGSRHGRRDAVPRPPPRRNPPPVHPRNRSPPQVKWLQLWA